MLGAPDPANAGRPAARPRTGSADAGAVEEPGQRALGRDPRRGEGAGRLRRTSSVYLEFDRADCGPCQRMDALLYPAFDFEALLIPMVPVKLSLESPEGQELARRYGIREAPSILVTTPEGRLVFLMQGFTNTREFYARIHPGPRPVPRVRTTSR